MEILYSLSWDGGEAALIYVDGINYYNNAH